MKKKLFSLLTALVLCLLCAVPAFAEMPLVMDTYELFKPEATAELEQKAQDASAGHGVNVYLLTVSLSREYLAFCFQTPAFLYPARTD